MKGSCVSPLLDLWICPSAAVRSDTEGRRPRKKGFYSYPVFVSISWCLFFVETMASQLRQCEAWSPYRHIYLCVKENWLIFSFSFFHFRASLPAPMFSRNTISVWGILKKCIGLVMTHKCKLNAEVYLKDTGNLFWHSCLTHVKLACYCIVICEWWNGS